MSQIPEQTRAFVIGILGCLGFSAGLLFLGLGVTPVADVSIPQFINPNHALLGSLIRLPGIGPARAEAIIQYRQTQQKNRFGTHVFREASDLETIKGIGPKTVLGLDPWLDLGEACCFDEAAKE
jgi:DNA uptake protein ComE-like DNA-binding protein